MKEENEDFDQEDALFIVADTARDEKVEKLLMMNQAVEISNTLTDKERHALELLEFCTNPDHNQSGGLTELELKFLQDFLVENMGNMALNKKLRTMNQEEVPGKKNMADFIGAYTYATQNVERFLDAADRLEDLYHSKDGSSNKITMAEAGIISRVVDLSDNFDRIRKQCPALFIGGYLEVFADKVKEAKQTYKKIEKDIFTEVNLDTGDLMFLDERKNSDLRGKSHGIQKKIFKQLISEHGHVSKLLAQKNRGENGEVEVELSQGHLGFTGYGAADNFQLKEYLYSHLLKIDVAKMVSKEKQEELDAKNSEWRKALQQQYRNIQDRIRYADQGEDNYKGMHAKISIAKKIEIGIAKFFSGDKKKERSDFTKIRDKMFNGKYSISSREREDKSAKKMMCSAFIAREMVASLVELDEFVKNTYGVEKAVEIPFDKDIKFSKVLPGRLYDILVEKGVCTEVSKSRTEQRIFATEDDAARVIDTKKIPQEMLVKIAEDAIVAYRLDNSKSRATVLRERLVNDVSELLIKEKNSQAIIISDKDLKFIQTHVDKLVAVADKQDAKSFIERWAEQAMDYIGIKKSEYNKTIESEVLKIRAIVKKHQIKQEKSTSVTTNAVGRPTEAAIVAK